MKSIINSFIQKNIEYKNRNRNKFMSLSKEKKDKYLDTKKKFITENLMNKACLTHKLSMTQNLKENKTQRCSKNEDFFYDSLSTNKTEEITKARSVIKNNKRIPSGNKKSYPKSKSKTPKKEKKIYKKE
jgi:hypothetical protein